MNTLRPWLGLRVPVLVLLALFLRLGGIGAAQAADATPARLDFNHPTFAHELPFAKHEVVIQVSSGGPEYWNLVLNNAQNLLDYFGQPNIRVVVVAFGPGLRMLLKNSPVAARLQSENSEGVEFDACHNTMKAMARKIGHMPVLAPQAVVVPAGVVRIMQLQKAGFAYIRP